MSLGGTARTAPVEPAVDARREDQEAVGSTRLLEAGLAFWLPLNGAMMIVPRIDVPVNELAAAILVAIALNRRPSSSLREIRGAVPLLVGLMAALGISALVNQQVDGQRLAHLAVWAGLLLALASGRLHAPSIARGLGAGVVVGVVVSTAMIEQSTYEGRLTGILGDPNTGGLFLIAYGLAAIPWLGRRGQWVVGTAMVVGVYLALSRTTMAAVAVGLTWLLLARGRGRAAGVAAGVALLLAVQWLESNLSQVGPFQGRSGSDDLRARIDLASQVKASMRPWIGLGPGTTQVDVEGDLFFFHSSYLAVRTEGGYLALAAVLGLMVAVVLAALVTRDTTAARTVVPLFAIVVCAGSLGDVFLEIPTAVAIGMAARFLLVRRAEAPTPPEAPAPPGG
jgi:hypothetical protein